MKKIVLCIACFSILLTGCTSKKEEKVEEKEPIYNENAGVTESKNVDHLIFETVSLEYLNGVSTIKTKVTNNGAAISDVSVNIIFKDENGKEMKRLFGYVGDLSNGSSTVLVSNDTVDLSKSYRVEYEVSK